jgi:3-oxocholest-4-en-26-oyl-CoA dehydrogenase beta subunit
MDFSFTDDQKAISELAGQILKDRSTLSRLKAIEASAERFDAEAWQDLAKAGLLGAGLPESVGGSGGGLVELALLLEQQGRRVSLLPLIPTLVSAASLAPECGQRKDDLDRSPRRGGR